MLKNLNFKIYTLGCKVNQSDSNELAEKLSQAGLVQVLKKADLAIINSCAVTQTAISKSNRALSKAKKENPKARIILIGCWPKVYSVRQVHEEVDIICGIKKLCRIIRQNYKLQIPNYKQILNSKFQIQNKSRSRYFLKIQDGCEQFCSYCIIPYTRGRLWSKPEAEVINEIKQAIKAGYEEIVLCGIHLGLYGAEKILQLKATKKYKQISRDNHLTRDCFVAPPAGGASRNDKNALVILLNKLIKIKDFGRIRLSSIEITEVSDELIKLMTASNKICRHLHIPLQSGSDKMLKLMKRPYGTIYFENKIKKIRKIMPDIAITTDVMVGFSGETEKEFGETYDFIKKIKFSRLHVFPFSVHEKTLAAKLPGRVGEKEKIKRAKILRILGEGLANDYKNKFKSKILNILVERNYGKKLIGKSQYYFDVEFTKNKIIDKLENNRKLIGKIIKVKI